MKPKYESEIIGNQEWITRNLDVDRFRNGDLITYIELDEEWEKTGRNGQPAWCYYDNNPENGKKYGKLYNWYAVNDPRGLLPDGWRIPIVEEFFTLLDYSGDEDYECHKIKSVDGWKEWEDGNGSIQDGNGDNSSGFNAYPCGFRNNDGTFKSITEKYGEFTFFWCDSELSNIISFVIFQNKGYYDYSSDRAFGFSVRCIKK
jgi:uncharacterized protein (TIGR02145 family)